MIAVLIPVLGRPERAQLVFNSVKDNSSSVTRILFLCSPEDDAVGAYEDTDADIEIVAWEAGRGDWARKINHGFTLSDEPFCLLGATDLRFHSGWDIEALRVAEESGCGVIGTNDLGNATVMRGLHSTHPLVHRDYVAEEGTIDEVGKCVHEGYHHQWVDTELCETAKARGQWAFAKDSHVEHLHPFWKKSKMDAVYEKALSTSREDHRIYGQRRRLWAGRHAFSVS